MKPGHGAIVLAVALALGGCSRAADEASRDTSAPPGRGLACGEDGQPDCPLQAWMKSNMSPAMRAGDGPRLETAFARAAQLAPDGYPTWGTIARSGAEAAARVDLAGVRSACKACHDEHRARFRLEMRSVALR
jgi:hypothetical protein